MGASQNKVVIADTQFLVTEALKSLLGRNHRFITKVVNTHYELQKSLDKEICSLLITDYALLDYESIDDLKTIKEKFQYLPVLILTNSVDKADFTLLTKIGIKNIIYKTADSDEIFAAIDAAMKGKKYYSEEILDMIIEPAVRVKVSGEPVHLTNSEIEIVQLIAGGLTTKQIAVQRNISFHTVSAHRKNIFRKLSVTNTSELIIKAIKAGWIDNIEYYI